MVFCPSELDGILHFMDRQQELINQAQSFLLASTSNDLPATAVPSVTVTVSSFVEMIRDPLSSLPLRL